MMSIGAVFFSALALSIVIFLFSYGLYLRGTIAKKAFLIATALGTSMPYLVLVPTLWNEPELLLGLLVALSAAVVPMTFILARAARPDRTSGKTEVE